MLGVDSKTIINLKIQTALKILFFSLLILFSFSFTVNVSAQSASCVGLKEGDECNTGNYIIRYYGIDASGNRQFTVKEVDTGTDPNYINSPFLTDYLAAMYRYAVIATTILVTIVIIFAGVLWITSAGNTEQIGRAKKMIARAVTGLILAVGSYTILWTINPQLVEFGSLKILRTDQAEFIEQSNDRIGDPDLSAQIGKASGKGNIAVANETACLPISKGKKMPAAFTTYWDVSAKLYGDNTGYTGIYKGSDTTQTKKMWDFLCKIAMECGCPSNYKPESSTPRDCINSRGNNWQPCKPFPEGTSYCPKSGEPCQTVAASSCFPKGCKIKVGDRILTVTDRGSAIIGTHFDLYLGVEGEPGFCNDTSWLTNEIEIVDCSGSVSDKTAQYLRTKYNAYFRKAKGYTYDICKPGVNCK